MADRGRKVARREVSTMVERRKIELGKVHTYPLSHRRSVVNVDDFADVEAWRNTARLSDLFPNILKGKEVRLVADAVAMARKQNKPVIFAIGAHIVKCGLSPILIDLMAKGVITALAMNGAAAIHDFEIALAGSTSEDVADGLKDGRFGMAEETPRMMNEALQKFQGAKNGFGSALGRYICEGNFPYKPFSLLSSAFELGLSATVHVAIGTDTVHMHPSADGAAIGAATFEDFKIFTAAVSGLCPGSCYFNVGSAVLMPEVFLKALNLARNLGYDASGFTAVNLDMVRHYRPEVNVLQRPLLEGGQGYWLIGHHEIMMPLLYSMIMDRLDI